MAGPRKQPVQDLVAEGPGSIRPAPETRSVGRGTRTPQGWSVVLSRPLPKGLDPGNRTQVAFAVWQGAHQEVGARKMRSVWVPLLLQK
jgi:DMSO reductase family type II enzyme heme b subunit